MRTSIALVLALAATGCVTPMPKGYVEVEEGSEYEWRGMSSEGIVIGLRERRNNPEGPLDFWATVLRKELERRKGYLFVGEEVITSGQAAGRAIHFSVPGPEPRDYWMAVFLVERRYLLFFSKPVIATFEVGGPRESLRKDLPVLREFLSKLDL